MCQRIKTFTIITAFSGIFLWSVCAPVHADTALTSNRIETHLQDIHVTTASDAHLKRAGLEELRAHAEEHLQQLKSSTAKSAAYDNAIEEATVLIEAAANELTISKATEPAGNAPVAFEFSFTEPIDESEANLSALLASARQHNPALHKVQNDLTLAIACFDNAIEKSRSQVIFEQRLSSADELDTQLEDQRNDIRSQFVYANSEDASRFKRRMQILRDAAVDAQRVDREVTQAITHLWKTFISTQMRMLELENWLEAEDEKQSRSPTPNSPNSSLEIERQHESFLRNHELIELSFLHQIIINQLALQTTGSDDASLLIQTLNRSQQNNRAETSRDTMQNDGADFSMRAGLSQNPQSLPMSERVRPVDSIAFDQFNARPVLRTSISSTKQSEILHTIREDLARSLGLQNWVTFQNGLSTTVKVCDD